MNDQEFYELALEFGFDHNKAEFLTKFVARSPHEHTADQITDFDDAVIETIEENEE